MAPESTTNIYRNQLLSAMSAHDIERVAPHLSLVEPPVRKDIEQPNQSIKHVFFPESGIVSIVGRGPHRKEMEIGIIGREGMTGAVVVMGNGKSPHQCYFQVAGQAHRMAADDLREAMEDSSTLRLFLLRYVQAFMIQATYTAICNGSAKLEERLARWLLMAQDRLDGDELPLIHDFLALMLGVRRPGVTVAIHSLEHQGLIDGRRGIIKVLDRTGLEKIANSSYGVPEAEYKRLMNGG
jgi:CRP-like cAMP-binding protein